MNLSRILLINLLTLLPAMSFASRTIMCDEPMGPRLDYFTQNTANLQNNQFLVGSDQMNDVHVRIALSDNNQDVSFAVGNMAQLNGMPVTNNMKVVMSNNQQISFMGMVNDGPILATFYPGMNILIYTQQAVWPGDSFSGARAMLFYARCHDLAAAPATQQQVPASQPAAKQPQAMQSIEPEDAEQVQGLAVPPQGVPPQSQAASSTVPATTATTPAATAQ